MRYNVRTCMTTSEFKTTNDNDGSHHDRRDITCIPTYTNNTVVVALALHFFVVNPFILFKASYTFALAPQILLDLWPQTDVEIPGTPGSAAPRGTVTGAWMRPLSIANGTVAFAARRDIAPRESTTNSPIRRKRPNGTSSLAGLVRISSWRTMTHAIIFQHTYVIQSAVLE